MPIEMRCSWFSHLSLLFLSIACDIFRLNIVCRHALLGSAMSSVNWMDRNEHSWTANYNFRSDTPLNWFISDGEKKNKWSSWTSDNRFLTNAVGASLCRCDVMWMDLTIFLYSHRFLFDAIYLYVLLFLLHSIPSTCNPFTYIDDETHRQTPTKPNS